MLSRGYKEPENWSDLNNLKDLLEERGDTSFKFFTDRNTLFNYRLLQESLARKSIDFLGGDFYAEKYDPLELPKREFDELKKARDRGVKVRILGRWDPSSPDIIHWAGEYVNAELAEESEARKKGGRIEIRSWGNGIRGGIFDDDQIYVIQRQYYVSPQEMSTQFLEGTEAKIVGRPQMGTQVPLAALVTSSPILVKPFKERFEEEMKKSQPMKNDLNLLKKPVPTKSDVGKENVLTF